ncbi:MAG: acetoin utilization protein AcuC [Pseudomonadota bacterium]
MFGAEIYRGSSYGDRHPLRVPRVSTVMDLTRALGWLPASQFQNSPRAKPKALRAWHTPDYIAALERAERDQFVSEAVRKRHGLGTVSNPIYPEMFRRPATSAGASLMSGAHLADGGIVYHPSGGTHHGMPDRAAGFCYLNDPVLAMLSLRAAGVMRMAYLDIDAHHGDGVEHAFAGDRDVLLISVHEERRWPFTGLLQDDAGGNALNLPVPKELNDSEMAEIRDGLLIPAIAAHEPEAIILQCGADAVTEDPLSRLALSNNAHWNVLRAILALGCDRLLVLGGGGYNPWSVGRLWAGLWGILNGRDVSQPVTQDGQFVLRALEWHHARAGKDPPEHWFTTLQDEPRPGPIRSELRARIAELQVRPAAQGRILSEKVGIDLS